MRELIRPGIERSEFETFWTILFKFNSCIVENNL